VEWTLQTGNTFWLHTILFELFDKPPSHLLVNSEIVPSPDGNRLFVWPKDTCATRHNLEAKFETLANHARDSKDLGNEPLIERLEPKVAS